ncbi:interleukin-26 [Synchiropus picturatus]
MLLLLGLLHAGDVATATNQQGLSCRREVPVALIRDLWSKNRQLSYKLPREKTPYLTMRLLPKFCITCGNPQHAISWPEVRQMIDIYQRSVFSEVALQELFPLHYSELIYQLQAILHDCVSDFPTKRSRKLKKLEKKIKKMKNKSGVMKAASEFTIVLKWIHDLMHQRIH